MFITKKHLSRRTFLQATGATMALPFLESMVPAMTAQSRTAASAGPRLGFIYLPHGAIMDRWTPATEGAGFEFTPILKPLEPFRNHLNVVTGTGHQAADSSAVHSLSPTTWLSGVRPKATQGMDAYAGVTADQFAAQKIGQDTLLPSLEIGTEDHSGLIGSCDRDYGCIYMNTLSWRTPTTPLPMEINPRKVFERMFGRGGSSAERTAQSQEDKSILDVFVRQAGDLQKKLGTEDRVAINNYLESVRDVERRVQRMGVESAGVDVPIPQAPAGIPYSYEDHVKLMYDLMLLAYQANVTKVVTYMLAREISNRTYPNVGVPDGHHAISHHSNQAAKMDKNVKIQTYHTSLFAQFLEKMQATPDGDGSLLDHTILIFGSNMSNSNAHNHFPLPNLVIGGGSGTLKGGRHLKYKDHTPMTNLLLTVLNKAGVRMDKLGDSTEVMGDL
jgi:hypothetical protein